MYSKELIRGILKPIILKLLAEHGKMYGYEICQKVKELTGQEILIKEGSLYPALYKLKAEGLVEVEGVEEGNRVRQYYSLANKGKSIAADQVKEFSLFLGTMGKVFNINPASYMTLS